MQIQDIYAFFQTPRPIFIRQEPAACYILHTLLEEDSYASELIRRLEDEYPGYKVSDSVFYGAVTSLKTEQIISLYWRRVSTRGRPCHMLKIQPGKWAIAQELAQFWQEYVTQQQPVLTEADRAFPLAQR